MATVKEISSAERLIDSLEAGGETLNPLVARRINKALKDGLTERELRDLIKKDILVAAGRQAKPLYDFLVTALDLLPGVSIPFADGDWELVNGRVKDIASEAILHKSTQPALRSAGILTDFITKQADETQVKIGSWKKIKWQRFPNITACDWCIEQAGVWSGDSAFIRHENCKCLMVRA